MKNRSKRCLGRKVSQSLANRDLTYTEFGLTKTVKILLLFLIIIISTVAGVLSGMLGGYIIRVTYFPLRFDSDFLLVICTILVDAVCLFDSRHRGFVYGLWHGITTSLLASLISAIYLSKPSFIGLALFFNLISLCVAFLSLSAITSAFSLISALFGKKQLLVAKFCALCMIVISIVIACLCGGEISERTGLAPEQFTNAKLISGLVWGYAVVATTFGVISSSELTKDFLFFKSSAIALASWGGTSFYNWDLSKRDFSGSRLANCDFRAHRLYRTRLTDVTGLERARVDNRYLDLDQPKVQQLLTDGYRGYSNETDFSHVNLQGAYLQNAIMRRCKLTEANLNGADLQGADLRDSILLRSRVTGVNFSKANLTGICIQDWSVNSETVFSGVQCDYVYREFYDNRPSDRYPSDRNFKPGEFESLFQKITNAVELVFQDQIDWRALSFTFEKFRVEDDGMGLELKGIEQRGDYWIVKVTHGEGVSRQQVEQQVHSTYEELRALLESKDKQINQLLGIVDNQTKAMYEQAEALTNFSKQALGNSFFISGSTITNLAGSGQIDYREAASSIRSLVTNRVDPHATLQRLISQLNDQNVATTGATQRELIQQVLISEANQDPAFRQFLLQQGQQIISSLPSEDIAIAIQAAISALHTS